MSDSYFGGKNGPGIAERLINAIPPHETLVVPFSGHCAVTRKIRRARRTILCDLDPEVIHWWNNTLKPEITAASDDVFGDGITVLQSDGLKLIQDSAFQDVTDPDANSCGSSCFIFCDPPYPLKTRGKTRYQFDWSDSDHDRLLDAVKSSVAHVMICSYPNEKYESELRDWYSFSYQSMTRGGFQKTEVVFCNYDFERCKLHDYRYLGKDRREREKLSRRERNLINRIKKMPDRERERYLERIRNEFFSDFLELTPGTASLDPESSIPASLQRR